MCRRKMRAVVILCSRHVHRILQVLCLAARAHWICEAGVFEASVSAILKSKVSEDC